MPASSTSATTQQAGEQDASNLESLRQKLSLLCLRSGDVTRKITIKMLPLLFFLLLPMTHKAFDLIVSLALPLSPSLCVCVSISLVLPYIHGCVCTYGGRGSNMSAYRWKGEPCQRSAQTKNRWDARVLWLCAAMNLT